jgi:hypothetical protein
MTTVRLITSFFLFMIAALSLNSQDTKDISLIIRGGDIGSSHSSNVACIESYMNGIMRSVELMVPGPGFPEAVRLFLFSLGIDYEFDIIHNGEKIFHQEGMFTPVDIDLTDRLKEKNQLLVKLNRVPKLHASPADRTQASQVT